MGLVYLGRSDLGRTVAVKVVQAEHAQHSDFRRRFIREVAAARRVGGAWTAAVLDADTEAAVPWVATQYIPGPDLTTVAGKDFGPLPELSVHTLANRLALALQAVHEAGLIHRAPQALECAGDRRRPTSGHGETSGLLLVKNGRVARIPTALHGMDLVQEINRLLRAKNITMTKLGTALTPWHVADARKPNPVASRLMAEHGLQPVTGAAVVAGAVIGHSPFPLDSDKAQGIALRLEQ